MSYRVLFHRHIHYMFRVRKHENYDRGFSDCSEQPLYYLIGAQERENLHERMLLAIRYLHERMLLAI